MQTRNHKSYVIPLKEFVDKFGITEKVENISYYKCGGILPEGQKPEEPMVNVSVFTDQ